MDSDMKCRVKTKEKRLKRSAWTILCVALLLLAEVSLAGCGESLDRKAESIVITDLAQVENETFEGFDNLKVLDLREVGAEAVLVDRLSAALPECSILWNVPVGGERFDSELQELTLPAGATAADLPMLLYFPNLLRVDATQCSVDAAFAQAAAAYGVPFVWNTMIGGVEAASTDTALNLSGQTIGSLEELEAQLAGLPALEQVELTGTEIDVQDVTMLESLYPGVAFIYDVDVFGTRVSTAADSLDLSQMESVDLTALQDVLPALPAVKSVDLSGYTVTFDEIDALEAAFPDISFVFSFEVCSQRVTTQTTRLELDGYALSSPEELAGQLKYLPDLEYADLCGCGLTNEQMEQLMAEFPSVKFVWMITVGAWEMRTDITAFSKGNRGTFPDDMGRFIEGKHTNLYDEDIEALKYCTDLVYLDLGHGNRITDVSVLANLTKLRVLIVSMNKIVDISPLAALQNLECLEIYQNQITDISVITQLPNLKYLNCSSILIDDITPLLSMQQLEMLWFVHNRYVDSDQRQQIKDALPDCEICFSAISSGEGGWTGNGLYKEYQIAFGLPYNQ